MALLSTDISREGPFHLAHMLIHQVTTVAPELAALTCWQRISVAPDLIQQQMYQCHALLASSALGSLVAEHTCTV